MVRPTAPLRLAVRADPPAVVIAMRRYGRRHTFPYLLSLALEYLSYSLRKSAAARLALNKASGPLLPSNPVSEAEQAETKKRANAFWWYLVRGPVWESWTKCVPPPFLSFAGWRVPSREEGRGLTRLRSPRPRLEAIATSLEDKPILGLGATIVKDYLPLIDDCESTSLEFRAAACFADAFRSSQTISVGIVLLLARYPLYPRS